MSGPALKHVDSHTAIHEAALNEAVELTELLDRLVKDDQKEKALELAFVIVEHWETRTLRHADSEEEGLYKDLLEEESGLSVAIIGLTRDHDLLRMLVEEIKIGLDKDGISDHVVQQFQALIIIDELHNKKEMEVLPDH